MHINVIQAILIGFLYFLCQSGTPWLTAFMGNYVRQPLVNGAIVGLIMGDPVQGLIIGSAINLPFIGVIMVGSTMPTDSALAGIVGTALALASGASPEVAVSMAVPIGLLGNLLWTVHMTKNCIFVHMMDKAAETGDVKRMNFLHVWPPQITTAFLMTIPVALVVYFACCWYRDDIAYADVQEIGYSILSAGFPDGDLSGILNDRCSIVCNHHCLFLYGSIFKKDR